jgi:SAM-dependent methyltransferase
MAKIYDDSRVFDEGCFNAALDFLTERFPPSKFKKLFEPGIGTGRIGIQLAERGYHVTGVDISENMLKVLAEKLSRLPAPIPLRFQKADVTALPFRDASFDIAVAVHVFHLIRDWKKAVSEVLRVLKPDAPLILFFTGSGDEVPAIKDRYRELCAGSGHSASQIGLSTNDDEFRSFLAAFDRRIETIENKWKWTQRIRVDESLRHIRSHYYSFTNLVPDSVHLEVVEKLERELQKQYGNLSVEVEVPNQMRLFLITT